MSCFVTPGVGRCGHSAGAAQQSAADVHAAAWRHVQYPGARQQAKRLTLQRLQRSPVAPAWWSRHTAWRAPCLLRPCSAPGPQPEAVPGAHESAGQAHKLRSEVRADGAARAPCCCQGCTSCAQMWRDSTICVKRAMRNPEKGHLNHLLLLTSCTVLAAARQQAPHRPKQQQPRLLTTLTAERMPGRCGLRMPHMSPAEGPSGACLYPHVAITGTGRC